MKGSADGSFHDRFLSLSNSVQRRHRLDDCWQLQSAHPSQRRTSLLCIALLSPSVAQNHRESLYWPIGEANSVVVSVVFSFSFTFYPPHSTDSPQQLEKNTETSIVSVGKMGVFFLRVIVFWSIFIKNWTWALKGPWWTCWNYKLWAFY